MNRFSFEENKTLGREIEVVFFLFESKIKLMSTKSQFVANGFSYLTSVFSKI